VSVRLALRCLIAIALILQGGLGASAAYAAIGHHCNMAGHHDGQTPKCPCCPAKSLVDCADACMTVAALPDVSTAVAVTLAQSPPPIERPQVVAAPIDTPLRPPIA
jgi:hypothetical protein